MSRSKPARTAKRGKTDQHDMTAWRVRLVIAILLDIADFSIGRVFGFGIASNLLLTVAGVGLFGWRGLAHLLEFLDPTHQIDGFVPTLTLIAWATRPEMPKNNQRRKKR